ncbi:MAG: hypothetical protein ACRENJ_00010, partial [Candidatus Eiseniibacteriota bacterium]
LGTSAAALAATRAHERAHVAQCERWGPLFLPAYAIASLVALARGADAYRDNWFEREAYAVANPDRGPAAGAHAELARTAIDVTPDAPKHL